MPQSLVLIGGSDRTNGDYSLLLSNVGATTIWSCPKRAQVGDSVYLYVASPISQIIATAKVKTNAEEGQRYRRRWRYVCKIGPIRLLKSPISIHELRELCPRWNWLRYPRAYAYVPAHDAVTIATRARYRSAWVLTGPGSSTRPSPDDGADRRCDRRARSTPGRRRCTRRR